MHTMTETMRQELQETGEIHFVDPETQHEYVAVKVELYERLKRLLAMDEYDPDEGMGHINEVMAEDAGRPRLFAQDQGFDGQSCLSAEVSAKVVSAGRFSVASPASN